VWGHVMLGHERNLFGSPGLRLVQLHILLSSTNRAYSLKQLAHIFQCSRQTILRMVDQLHLVPKVKIETWVEGRERHFRFPPQPRPSAFSFTPDTVSYIALCLDVLRHLLPDTIQHELEGMQGATAQETMSHKGCNIESYAEPWTKGHIDYAPFQDILRDLQTAMRERRLCHLDYHSRSSGERQTLLVAPTRLIVYHEAIYLRCRIYTAPEAPRPHAGGYRTLAIHRIKKLRVDSTRFSDAPHEEHDPNFGFPFHEPIEVRVAFWGGAATYVGERTWSEGQRLTRRKDGALVLTFTTTSRLEVIAWVLGFGADAEVLGPKDLREELGNQANAILARYVNVVTPARQHEIRFTERKKRTLGTDATRKNATNKEK